MTTPRKRLLEKIRESLTNTKKKNPDFERLPNNAPLEITYKPHIIKKSQRKGERDLVDLATEKAYEGCWLYTPEDTLWYHVSIGHVEKVTDSGDDFLMTTQYTGHVETEGNKMYHYHTHPSVIKDEKGELVTIHEQLEDEVDIPLEKRLQCSRMEAHSALPSALDMAGYISMQRYLDRNGVNVTPCIASPAGITYLDMQDPKDGLIGRYVNMERAWEAIFIASINEKNMDRLFYANEAIIKEMFRIINCAFKDTLHFTFKPRKAALPPVPYVPPLL